MIGVRFIRAGDDFGIRRVFVCSGPENLHRGASKRFCEVGLLFLLK